MKGVPGTAGESVLYILLRDGDVAPGRLEKLIQDVEKARREENVGSEGFVLTNPHLAAYAKEIIARLERLK